MSSERKKFLSDYAKSLGMKYDTVESILTDVLRGAVSVDVVKSSAYTDADKNYVYVVENRSSTKRQILLNRWAKSQGLKYSTWHQVLNGVYHREIDLNVTIIDHLIYNRPTKADLKNMSDEEYSALRTLYCSQCDSDLPKDGFYLNSSNGRHKRPCKACRIANRKVRDTFKNYGMDGLERLNMNDKSIVIALEKFKTKMERKDD